MIDWQIYTSGLMAIAVFASFGWLNGYCRICFVWLAY